MSLKPNKSDAQEQARRRRAVDEARHSSQMSGARSGEDARALQERYVAGEITADELVEQSRQMVAARRGRQPGAHQETNEGSSTMTQQIDEKERARREHDVRAIRHSTVMEGGSVTPETMALQDAWVRGEITGDQMVDAVRRRYGLTDSE